MRGTGKTVLLNELGRIAADRGWRVVEETASPGFCGRILESLTPRAGTELKGGAFRPGL